MDKRGFTLAEVLITLAIIGIVAALTIPAVVKNYQKIRAATKLKKAYSVMNQAHRLAEVDNGPYETWDVELSESSYYQKYLGPYFKGKSSCSCGGWSNKYCSYRESAWKNIDGTATQTGICAGATFITTDDIVYAYRASTTDGEGNLVQYTYIYVDINGPQEPNRIGKDVFVFNRNKKGVVPLAVGYSFTNINNGCSSSSGYYCAAKIMADGWEIKDDYPW